MISEWVAYRPPNPPPKKEETNAYSGGDLISFVAAAANYPALTFSLSIHAIEIIAILARDASIPSSSAILSTLFANPSAADQLDLNTTFFVGLALLVFGASVRKACYVTLGRHFTFQLAILKEHKLVTWGPYAVVRHPSYTGMIAAIIGTLTTQLAHGGWMAESGMLDTFVGKAVIGAWVLWMAWIIQAVVRRVPNEDEVLRKEFKNQWEEWARRTPYALFPYIY
ncbi:ICMT-domain-containing protein [Trametes punicea]|nr:ICMT-domain-containing protein [Trametes punicea]